ncbi:MAG: hypothetical protein KDI30_12035 [Pseudomonadales bacterium]|nr:hypothetical protein [Pseudomonadales bacterium]
MADKDQESTDDLLNELESIKKMLNDSRGRGDNETNNLGDPSIPTLLPVTESPDLSDVILSSKDISKNDYTDSMKRALAELESLELGKASKPVPKPKKEPEPDIPTLIPEKPASGKTPESDDDKIPTLPTLGQGTDKPATARPQNPQLTRKIQEIPLHELLKPEDLVEALIREYLPKMEAELRQQLTILLKDIANQK